MPSERTGDSEQGPAAMSDLSDLRTYAFNNLGTVISRIALVKVKARVVPNIRAT